MGRKSTYNPRIADVVLRAIGTGSNTQAACDLAGIKRTTWLGWLTAVDGLRDRLVTAKSGETTEQQAEVASQQPRKRTNARLAQRTERSGRTRIHPARAVKTEKPATQPAAPAAREAPTITGSCAWTANRAAAVMLIEIGGIILDNLRRELRRSGQL